MGENPLQPDILKQLFVNRLPANVQMILASIGENTPVEELAELADRIMEVTTTVAPVTQAQSSTNPFMPTPSSSELTELRVLTQQQARQIQTLTDQLQALTRNQPRRNDNQHFCRRRSRCRDRPGSYCYYHQRFGEKARKCESPCSYQQSTPSPSGNDEARL